MCTSANITQSIFARVVIRAPVTTRFTATRRLERVPHEASVRWMKIAILASYGTLDGGKHQRLESCFYSHAEPGRQADNDV